MKTKSDASTCTRDEIDLVLPECEQSLPPSTPPGSSPPPAAAINKRTFVTKADIETNNNVYASTFALVDNQIDGVQRQQGANVNKTGIDNQAYQIDEVMTSDENEQRDKGVSLTVGMSHQTVSSTSSNSTYTGVSSDDDGDSDVSTTIIDGKRAISISNFGKFAEQQQKRDGIRPMLIGPTFGHPMASAGFRAIKNAFPK